MAECCDARGIRRLRTCRVVTAPRAAFYSDTCTAHATVYPSTTRLLENKPEKKKKKVAMISRIVIQALFEENPSGSITVPG